MKHLTSILLITSLAEQTPENLALSQKAKCSPLFSVLYR
jgi:hypothetical protein